MWYYRHTEISILNPPRFITFLYLNFCSFLIS
nr:MAG TPA: hypothetical protein [Caudoviricetes sp.]